MYEGKQGQGDSTKLDLNQKLNWDIYPVHVQVVK